MKQFSMLLLATVCAICSLAFFSCNNEKSNHGQGPETPTIDSCLLNSAVKEKACWDEYDKCISQVESQKERASQTCLTQPEPQRTICLNKVLLEYASQFKHCNDNLRTCLTESQNYRKACLSGITKQPDTK